MDGFESIKNAIMSEAREQEAAVLGAARLKASQLLSEAETAAAETARTAANNCEEIKNSISESERRSRELMRRKQIGACQAELIDDVFDGVRERLSRQTEKEREALAESLVREATAGAGTGELVLNAADRAAFGKRLAEKTGTVLSADTADISGGVILRAGRIDVNCSYEVILRELRETRSGEVRAALFTE